MQKTLVGIIGGSGLYNMEALQDANEHHIDTPFGKPSDVVVTGNIDGVGVAFIARHGRGHRLIPQKCLIAPTFMPSNNWAQSI
jgi:5'-methylthioadenosine phosphorylase